MNPSSPGDSIPITPLQPDFFRQQVFSLAIALIFLAVLLYLAGRGRFNLRYCLLWFTLGAIALLLAVFPGILYRFSSFVGVGVPVNALFLVAFFSIGMLLVQLTVAITKLEEQAKTLAQQLAIARARLERLDRTEEENPREGLPPRE